MLCEFPICDAANASYEAVPSFSIAGNTLTATLIRLSNVVDSASDYLHDIFEDAKDEVPRLLQVPTPYWFVAYWKNDHGYFIHDYKYLQTETSVIPESNIKKYRRGILTRAKN